MTSVTLNGNTYNDGNTPPNNLGNGGFRTYLMSMLADGVTDFALKQTAAAASQLAASISAAAADASNTAAAASAATALAAPGTNATSTTSLTTGVSSQSLTIQTGKSLVVGMTVKIASTVTPTTWMAGDITAYNSGTGALVVNVTRTNGPVTTAAAWTVSLSGPVGVAGANGSVSTLGGASTTSATSITLTNASVQTQNVTMSAAGQAVIMPDATTLTSDGLVYIVRNTGTINFDVQDSTGQCIFAGLLPNKSVIVWARDITTAAGLWALLGNQAVQTTVMPGLASVWAAATVVSVSSCSLNATQALVAFNVGGFTEVAVLTAAGNVITANSYVNLEPGGSQNSEPAPYAVACCQAGTNQAIVVTGESRAVCVTVSGTGSSATLSIGGSVPFAQACEAVSVAPAGTGTAIVTYQVTATHAISACVVTYDAANNVCVAGQGNSVAAAVINGSVSLSNIGVDTILVTYQTSTSVFGYVLTGVAGVYTKGTTYTLVNAQALATSPAKSCSIGGNQAMLVYGDTANSNFITGVVISITGSVLAVNTKQQIQATAAWPLGLCQMTTANALVHCSNSNLFALSVSGTTITVGVAVAGTGSAVSTAVGANALCQTNTNKAVLAYWDASASIFARVISVSGTTITLNAASTAMSGTVGANPVMSICQTNTDQAVISAWVSGSIQGVVASIYTGTTTAAFSATTAVGAWVTAVTGGVAPTAASGAFAVICLATDTNYIREYGGTVAAGSAATPALGTVNNTSWPLALPNFLSTWQTSGAYSSSGKAIFAPGDGTYGTDCYTFLAQASGTTVTSPTIGYSVATGTSSIPTTISAQMATNTAVIAYRANDGSVAAEVATATGYTLAFGAILTVFAGSGNGISISYVAANKWVVGYNNATTNYQAKVLTASGTTLSAGAALSFGVGVAQRQSIAITSLSATQAVATYCNTTVSMSATFLNISGSTLTASADSPVAISAAGETFLSSCLVGANAIVSYADQATPFNGKSQLLQYVKE